MHWASISTGISSILAVVVITLIIAGCCYFRGRRQQQSRARHTELLRNIATSRHSSTPVKVQSGAYPGPSSSDFIRADPFVFDAPGRASIFDSPIGGPAALPAIQFSPLPPPAGCLVARPNINTSTRNPSPPPRRSPSPTTQSTQEHSNFLKTVPQESTPCLTSALRPVHSVDDYNLSGVKACDLRPGSVARMTVHF